MKSFLIIGMGRFGSSLAKELYKLGNEVVVVDKDEEQINKVADFVTHAMTANVQNEQVLKSLGARNFDFVIVAFSSNLEASILATIALKEMNVRHIIAKGRDEQHIKVLKKIGADRIIFPEQDMGVKLAQVLSAKNMVEYVEVSPHYSIAEMRTPKSWVGKSIKQLNVRAHYGVNILIVKNSDGEDVNSYPSPDYVFNAGDILVMMGADEDLGKVDRI